MARKTRSKRRQSRRQSGGVYSLMQTASDKRRDAGRQMYIDKFLSRELQRRERLKTPGAKPRLGEPCTKQFFGTQCEDSANQHCSEPMFSPPSKYYDYTEEESRCVYRDNTKNKFVTDYDVGNWYDPNYFDGVPSIREELNKMKFSSDGGARRTRKRSIR